MSEAGLTRAQMLSLALRHRERRDGVSATVYRRREFGQQRLVGATPPQVLAMVGWEGLVLLAAGLLFGSIASAATVIPYSIARTGSVLPESTLAIYVGIVVLTAAVTFAATFGATRRVVTTPILAAVGT